jgi:predicted nucleic acid-binding protein
MPLVIDASVTVCWAFDDEEHSTAVAALDRLYREEAVVPGLWWFELRNALIMNERRARITKTGTNEFLRDLSRLRILIDRDSSEAELMDLARLHRLTIYDATYLELALRTNSTLATLDDALAGAATAEGVPLL